MLSSFSVRRTHRLLAAAALAGVTSVTLVHAALVAIETTFVKFQATGPAGLKIDGDGSKLEASESNGVLKIVSSVTNLKTGMDLRDEHLRKAIHAEKHGTATLEVPRSGLQFPADQKELAGSAKGKFTLNGTTKDIAFDYKVKREGSDYSVQGKTEIDITQFNIEKPCYLGVCVEKDVKIKVKFKLREK